MNCSRISDGQAWWLMTYFRSKFFRSTTRVVFQRISIQKNVRVIDFYAVIELNITILVEFIFSSKQRTRSSFYFVCIDKIDLTCSRFSWRVVTPRWFYSFLFYFSNPYPNDDRPFGKTEKEYFVFHFTASQSRRRSQLFVYKNSLTKDVSGLKYSGLDEWISTFRCDTRRMTHQTFLLYNFKELIFFWNCWRRYYAIMYNIIHIAIWTNRFWIIKTYNIILRVIVLKIVSELLNIKFQD